MSNSRACGIGYSFGLITAVTAVLVWRSPFVDGLCRWFWYRKEAPRYRYPFPRLFRRR
jgi:hypothetical protein